MDWGDKIRVYGDLSRGGGLYVFLLITISEGTPTWAHSSFYFQVFQVSSPTIMIIIMVRIMMIRHVNLDMVLNLLGMTQVHQSNTCHSHFKAEGVGAICGLEVCVVALWRAYCKTNKVS